MNQIFDRMNDNLLISHLFTIDSFYLINCNLLFWLLNKNNENLDSMKSDSGMVYHFGITSDECKNFRLEVKLSDRNSFFDLHSIIQRSLGYESHQLASFFISDKKGLKDKEISMLDLGISGAAYLIMQKTKLSDWIVTTSQRLLYTFDFVNDRSLIIELTNMIMKENLSEPFVTLKQGDTPMQVLNEEVDVIDLETTDINDEKVYSYFGELEDYTEIFGEMDDF